jgi:uncharacterized damage-inducible protein DinB
MRRDRWPVRLAGLTHREEHPGVTELTATNHLTVPLTTVYQGWDGFQRNLVKAIAPLSREQLALPAAPTHWPIGMLVQHIINDRLWWFDLWMGEACPEEASFMHWEEEEKGDSIHSADELVAGLEATWGMIERALAQWTVADLDDVFEPPESLTAAERAIFGSSTRQEIIFHVLRHDIHHGGELAVGMGQYHLPTIWG